MFAIHYSPNMSDHVIHDLKSYEMNFEQRKIETYWKNDEINGSWEKYHPNGVLAAKGIMSNSLEIGEWKYYDLNGILIETKKLEG